MRLSVFVNREVAAIEVGDDVVLIVHDGGVQRDFVHFLAKDKYVAALFGGSLSRSLRPEVSRLVGFGESGR